MGIQLAHNSAECPPPLVKETACLLQVHQVSGPWQYMWHSSVEMRQDQEAGRHTNADAMIDSVPNSQTSPSRHAKPIWPVQAEDVARLSICLDPLVPRDVM